MAKSYDEVKKEFTSSNSFKKSDKREKQDEWREIDNKIISSNANSYLSSFIKDSQDYLKNSESASSYYSNNVGKYADLSERSKSAKKYLSSMEDSMDWQSYNSMVSYINDFDKYAKNANDYYSQWDNEEKYNESIDAQKRREELMSYDLDNGKSEIEALKKQKDDALTYYGNIISEDYASKQKQFNDYLSSIGYSSSKEIDNAISKKESEYNQAKWLQDGENLKNDALHSTDFNDYSEIGKSLSTEKNKWWEGGGTYKNNIGAMRNDPAYIEAYEQSAKDAGTKGNETTILNQLSYKAAKYMTDEEYNIYSYYLAKENDGLVDKGTAEKYLKSIEETLTTRQATKNIEELDGNTLKELLYGYSAGIDQFRSGLLNLANTSDNYIPASGTQVTSSMVREDLGDKGTNILGSSIGQIAYDTITTVSNMLPTIASSMVANAIVPGSGVTAGLAGQIVGNTLMGASAAGNEYQGMLNSGMNKDQARAVSLVQGAWEGLSEYYLGAIEGIGGKKISKLLNRTDFAKGLENAGKGYVKAILDYFVDMSSEGMEEIIQDIGSSVINGVMTGEWEFSNAEELAYSFALGALSAGVMNLPSATNQAIVSTRAKSLYWQNQSDLVQSGLESAKGTESRSLAETYKEQLDKGKNLSGIQIAKLVEANDQAIKAEEADATAKAKFGLEDDALSKKVSEEESAPTVKQIKSIANGKMTLEMSDGTVIDSKDAVYNSNDKALMYESMLASGYDANTANAIVNAYDENSGISVSQYLLGTNEAYNYGKVGYPQKSIKSDGFYSELTDGQKNFAYKLGSDFANAQVKSSQEAINNAKSNVTKKGNVHLPVNYSSLTQRQKVSVSTVGRVVADITHNDVYFFESVDRNGQRVFANDFMGYKAGDHAPNGLYIPKTGAIYIDINAGNSGEGTILWTASHELTHFTKQWSPEKFKSLSDFLMNEYGKKGADIETLISNQINKAKKSGRELSRDDAFEEVVADSMTQMFTDTNLAEKLEKLKKKDRTLWQKVKDFFANLYKKISEVYKGLKPQSQEAKYVSEMKNSLEKISNLFAEALVDAGNTFESIGIAIDTGTESANPLIMSERTWNESDYVRSREQAAKEMADALEISVANAKDYIDTVNSIAKIIANDRVRLDYEASEGVSSFVGNTEYGGSIDFSTICKKRRLLTGTFSAIQQALPNTALTAEEVLAIRKMMDEKGYEVSCGLCYVEGSRAKMGEYAKDFLNEYAKKNPEYLPNMAEINTPDGIEKIRIEHPEVYQEYQSYMNALAQRKPKLYQMATEYKGEVLNKFRKSDSVNEKNDNGGLRLQSFSDFEIIHLIDCMQVIMDMSRVGLAGQAYTKVADFAAALGNTGLKINLSLIAKGTDSNGKLILDEKEGMKKSDAKRLRDMYSDNVGTILVVFNDEQLKAALADDFIDYIIPFHRSQWNSKQYELMGLPKNAKDYTKWQNESYINPVYNSKGKKTRPSNYMPNTYWDFSKTGKENAESYLNMCALNNRLPKFSHLLVNNGDGSYSLQPDGSTDGYWKLLIDFKMYNNEGVGVPQKAVSPDFNMDEAYRMLNEYKGGHESFPIAQDIVDEFVSKYKKNHQGQKFSDRNEFVDSYTGEDVKFSIREEEPPKNTIDVYKLMRYDFETKKLYPLYIDRGAEVVLGQWYNADSPSFEMLRDLDIGYHLIDFNTGEVLESKKKMPSRKEVDDATTKGVRWMSIKEAKNGASAKKASKQYGGIARQYYNVGINGSEGVTEYALRPGWHSASLPVMDQIGNTDKRNIRADNFVWVKGKISFDIDYQAEAESNPSGENDIPFHIPTDGAYIKGTSNMVTKDVTWYISGAFMPEKIISDREARKVIDNFNESIKDKDATPMHYDYPRNGGMIFDGEKLIPGNEKEVEYYNKAKNASGQKVAYLGDLNNHTKFSDRDSEYMELAKNPEKNEKRLRELVDEAAINNGFKIGNYYHGTSKKFTVFDNDKVGKHTGHYTALLGTYFSTNENVAKQFSDNTDNVVKAFLKDGNYKEFYSTSTSNSIFGGYGTDSFTLLEQDIRNFARENIQKYVDKFHIAIGYVDVLNSKDWVDFFDKYPHAERWDKSLLNATNQIVRDYVSKLRTDGYDGIYISNTLVDTWGVDGVKLHNAPSMYIVFDNNNIKSADLVTYDDSGNIIPISERFNANDEDIRYSFRGESTATSELDRQNLETAKEMDKKKVSMENIRLATGWYKQSDKKWRNEFSDQKAKLKPSALIHFASNDTTSELDRLYKNANEINEKVNHLLLSGDYDGARELSLERKKAVDDFRGYNSRLVREAKKRQDATYKLKDLLTFPELYKYYPQLADMSVNISGISTSTLGLYDLNGKFINLSKAISQDQALTTLLHEVQHAIQDIEGMPQDNNRSYTARRVEQEAFDVESRHNLTEKQRKETAPAKFSDRILMGSEFSGGGMLEAGLVYQMLDKEFAVEYDEKIAAVYRDNWGEHIYAGPDKGNVYNFDISKHAKDLFYFHASPVCHEFSKAKHGGKENVNDIKSAMKVAKDLEIAMPQVFTVENAPAYLNSKSLKIITDKLTELGYKWRADVYNSADYGSATSRERCILTAVKTGTLPDKPATMPRTNSWDKVTRNLWDGLKVSKAENGKPFPDYYIDAMRNTKKLQGIFNSDGTITVDRPLLVITTTSGHEVTFAWEGSLCPTLTTKCGEGRLILPGKHISLDKPNENIKRVSPEFMGAIQGLPDGSDGNKAYDYGKAKTRAFTIIGNGIPTQLTKTVIGGVLDSAYEQTHEGKKLYSDRNVDTEYIELAKNPKQNEARLRELVDEAAKKAGYSIKAYHGTGADFTKFSRAKTGINYDGYLEFGAGFYFTPNEKEARKWAENGRSINGSKVMSVYLSAERMMNPDEPLFNDKAESTLKLHGYYQGDINFTLSRGYRFINALFDFGYTNTEVQETLKSMGYDGIDASYGLNEKKGQYVIFDPEQVKSADLVTYDDSGNIIPLSERFNEKNEDIRYSDRGNGYDGYSMSNNARAAYEDGEKPLSKWTKSEIINAISEVNPDIDCSKINAETLKSEFLKQTSWHHTSMYYNKTDFYSIDTEYIKKLTQSDIDEIDKNQTPLSVKKRDNSLDAMVDDAYFKALAIVESGMVKTENGAISRLLNGKDFEGSYNKALELIRNRDKQKVDAWRKLPEDHYRQEYVRLYDNDFEAYINKMYADKKLSRNSNVFKSISNYFQAREVKYSDRNLPDNAEEIAKDYFGATNKWSETGYLLKDGTQLDFSGRHWSKYDDEIELDESYFNGERNAEHFEILDAFDGLGNTTMVDRGSALDAFIGRGNIRIDGKYEFAEIGIEPTEEQYEKLYSFFKQAKKYAPVVGYRHDYRADTTFPVGTDASTIVESIRKHFANSSQSDIMQFHTMYSDRNPDATDNRTLLSNALATTAQNDIEKKYIEQYQSKIDTINEEQKKLTELRAKIKELSFAKGHRDADQISKLQTEATKTANRINTFDKQLLKLESTKPLQEVINREKTLARKKAEKIAKENLNAYREKAAQTQRELMNRYQERIKKSVIGRNTTELRNKVKKVAGELNSYLLTNSKEKHVPLGMQEAVAEALDIINMDTVDAEARFNGYTDEKGVFHKGYNQLIEEATDPEVKQTLIEKAARIQKADYRLQEKLTKLKAAYDEIKNDPKTGSVFDQDISDKIQLVAEYVKDTSIKNMTFNQLEEVYDMFKMILHKVRNANKAFKQGRWEEVVDLSNSVIDEAKSVGDIKEERLELSDKLNTASFNELKPIYFFERIGSKTLKDLFLDIRKGEDVWGRDIDEAKTFIDEVRDKYNYKSWDLKKRFTINLESGANVSLTLEQMMSIYAYSKREQAIDHMEKGGFIFNSSEAFKKDGKLLKYVPSLSKAFRIKKSDVETIKSTIKDQIGYVDEMQKYLSEIMAQKGNETSNIMWDVDLFKEKVYFPLKSSKDFIFEANTPAGEVALKSAGMTKGTVPHASNPIVLEDFDDVWANHVNQMSMYHAMVVPLDNMNKVFNYTGYSSSDESESVSTVLRAIYGNGSVEYIKKLIQDANGGITSEKVKSPIAGLVGTFKKTAVAASASVIVQQPTAIIRAMSMVDPKYFIPDKSMKHSAKWNQLKKYAPVAVIKEIGGFDAGSGRQASAYLNPENTLMNKIDDITMRGAGLADEIGWNFIWDAVKKETKDKHNLSGEELLTKAGERFTEVVMYTQVYDSVLSRSAYMRSTSDLVKMATSFMGEPTTTFNMLYNSVLQAKRGTMSKGTAVKTIAFTFAASIAAAVAKSFVTAGRDDDKDKDYWEKFIEKATSSITDELFIPNMLPWVKDIVSIFDGWDIERTDMSLFSDLKNAIDGLDSTKKSMYRKLEDLLGAFANFFGLPVKNIMRDGRALYNIIYSIFNK